MKNFVINILLAILLIVTSCKDLFDTTQSKKPEFLFENNASSIQADGVSWVIVTLQFQRLLSDNQQVVISTSAGGLLEFPASEFTKGSKTLNVVPNRKSFSFILVSSSKPNDKVLLSANLNNMVSTKLFQFTEVCPNLLYFDLSTKEMSLAKADRSTANIILSNNGKPVSDGIQVEFTTNDNTMVRIDERIIYNNTQSTITLVPLGVVGEVEVTATVTQNGCPSLSKTQKIQIIE